MSDIYEIYEGELKFGFGGEKRVLKNGKAVNEFGLLKDIKKLQAENEELKKQSQWISVDDELPGFDNNYLVTGRDIELEFCHFSQDWGWQDDFDITHWMPLPTPPEGE